MWAYLKIWRRYSYMSDVLRVEIKKIEMVFQRQILGVLDNSSGLSTTSVWARTHFNNYPNEFIRMFNPAFHR
jgi:hypothetical protein